MRRTGSPETHFTVRPSGRGDWCYLACLALQSWGGGRVHGCSKAVLESLLTVYRSLGQEGILQRPNLWYGLASSRYVERSRMSAKDVVEGSTQVSRQLFTNVLNLIPCPLLMIAGSCAWENYSAAIKHKSKMISFEAAAGVELEYALEFEDEKMLNLRRITAKVDHPSYGFNQPRRAQHIAKRFDTQSNLMLYLGDRKFNANSYRQAIGDVELGRKRSAPLRELWAYRSIEEKQKNALREADFDSSFLIWVRGHLTPRRTKILFETGESVLVPILTAIKKKQSNLAFEREEINLILKGLALREGVRKFIKPRVRGILYLETEIHHFKLSVPYEEQDAKSIRESKGINVDLKVEFIDDVNSKTLAAPNAGPSDSAQGLRIEVNYEIQRGLQTVPVKLYCEPKKTAKLHIRLCQMNSLADAVTAKSSRYTRLQPHRLIVTNEKGVSNGYTSCQSTDCEVCAGFARDKYIKKTRDGNGL